MISAVLGTVVGTIVGLMVAFGRDVWKHWKGPTVQLRVDLIPAEYSDNLSIRIDLWNYLDYAISVDSIALYIESSDKFENIGKLEWSRDLMIDQPDSQIACGFKFNNIPVSLGPNSHQQFQCELTDGEPTGAVRPCWVQIEYHDKSGDKLLRREDPPPSLAARIAAIAGYIRSKWVSHDEEAL